MFQCRISGRPYTDDHAHIRAFLRLFGIVGLFGFIAFNGSLRLRNSAGAFTHGTSDGDYHILG